MKLIEYCELNFEVDPVDEWELYMGKINEVWILAADIALDGMDYYTEEIEGI